MWDNIIYFLRQKYNQIKRTIDFLPLIWNGFDFDYAYALGLFQKQLERQAKFMESDSAHTLRAKQNASKIRTAISLMDKVYDDEYGMEWMDKINKKYGEGVLDWEFEDTGKGDGSTYLKYKYEKWHNANKIKEDLSKFTKESREKQKRAHKILWDYIEHNIQGWWD